MKYKRSMKQFAFIMILVILLSGCKSTTKKDVISHSTTEDSEVTSDNSQDNTPKKSTNTNQEEKDNNKSADKVVETTTTDNEKNNKKNTSSTSNNRNKPRTYELVWQDEKDIHPINIPYVAPQVSYKIPHYTIDPDLSNIENLKYFTGFSEEQLQKIRDNGFVVLPRNQNITHLQMYSIYDENEYKRLPNFITVDSVMHLYHMFFDGTLKVVERDYLFDELVKLTDSMLDKSLYLYNNPTYDTLKDDMTFIMSYFAIAKKLLTQDYGELPSEIKAKADEEVKYILEAGGPLDSPLLGRIIDYSQYKVRGHYTDDENLQSYFKAMMWYGQIGLPLTEEINQKEELCVDETVRAMLMTYMAFMQTDGQSDIESWDRIYSPTNFYVGQSDDLNLYQYKELICNVFGTEFSINDFRDDSYYDKLLEEAIKMPEPGIKHKITQGNIPTGKQFRFMGQRYTFDGEIMQELMKPFKRPVPSGLDVAAVLGSNRAKELLDTYYEPQKHWPEYEDNFKRMKEKISKISEADWRSNMYNGWLWTTTSIQKSFEDVDGVPMFMKNTAWTDKSISSALGSYTELKHDTILYTKQPVAECGGPETQYHHYVEPNVEVYSKLLWLTEYSKTNLQDRELLSERFGDIADRMITLLTLLRDCSIKELNNETLNDDEQMRLNQFGGAMDSIIYNIISETGGAKLTCSAVIADVATIESSCLELATGLPNEIYVVIKDGDGLYLARGAVFGYYEFLNGKRLNDVEWHEMLGVVKEKVEDGVCEFFMLKTTDPSPSLPEQPEWVYSFKSREENNLQLEETEVNWD